ncbi:mediator complex subunit [Vermiconidia calcicola]|uniref:Mediator complex subunit n=1 Tax=Vermiconidia calcicola TaxID=1690605 RepID=A0ACC3NPQ7_9PEZI|nr:mediator complex subunit [Vermiconidia calcicola]
MPGRLVMDQEGAIGSQDLKKATSHAQVGKQDANLQAQPMSQSSKPVQNGVNGGLPNGIPATSDVPASTNGESSDMAVTYPGPDNPPPLDQSWREGDNNKSLGLLMERVAQQCYFELNGCLTSMSQIPLESQQQQTNGVVSHTGQDTSEASMKKKRLLMEFANTQRDRFIKTLVLADWCRNEEEKARLVDVKVWQDKQRGAYAQAAQAIANTKLNMIGVKTPNPNIEGAMEVLATGKASWVPHLGYIPPKRLTAKQLLKTLRGMNVTLATRLNLHEELPAYFQEYSIADGRATFSVQHEFEVDLSVADEDPATPFYFIDIRLAFTPASSIADERMRAFMEGKVNHELATKGLKGCYDFLHNFVLTHKLNILRSQALEMLRGKWFDCIRIENLRRSLVVQYWVGMPGPKSWIEISVSSGKQKDGGRASRKPATPRLSVRWFRRGEEVKDEVLGFDWRELDMQRCLELIVARHSAWVMRDLQRRLRGLAPVDSPFEAKLVRTDDVPDQMALLLSLPSLREPLSIQVEPVTGQYSITPPSAVTFNTERRLNNDANIDAARWLAILPCAVVQERLRKEAELLDWTPAQNLLRQDNLATIFGERITHFSIFKPSRAWSDTWALAVTFTLGGEKWWVVELEAKRNEQTNVMGKVIIAARRISLPNEPKAKVSRPTLLQMERLAVAEVSMSTLATELRDMRISHSFEKLSAAERKEQNERFSPTHSFALFVRFSQLMRSSLQAEGARGAWADEVVRLTHHGVVRSSGKNGSEGASVQYDLRLSLRSGKLKELARHLTHSKGRDLALNPSSGGLALRFHTTFGQPFVRKMQQQLRSVERLDRYVTLLKQRRFVATHVGLERLAFTYYSSPELSAELLFSNDDDGRPMRLRLLPVDKNPHQRIRVMLEKGLKDTDDKGFEALTFILPFTLPVVQTFERLEAKDQAKQTISIHPRSSTWYSVRYRAPLRECVYQVKAKVRQEGKKRRVEWLVNDVRAAVEGESLPEEMTKALKELWQQSGEGWMGLGSGIVADAQGVTGTLEKLDELVRRFEGTSEVPQPVNEAETGTARQTQAQPASKEPPKKQTPAPAPAPAASKQPPRTQPAKPKPSAKQDRDVIMLD